MSSIALLHARSSWPAAEHRWWHLYEIVRRRDRAVTVPTPPLVRGEHILLRCLDQDRAALVASDRALYRSPEPDGNADRSWARLGWEQIGNVAWNQARGTLILTGLLPPAPRRTEFRLSSSRLPDLARERVTSTRLAAATVPLHDRHRAQVSVRRQPGTGNLLWIVAVGDGIDPNLPQTKVRLDRAIAHLWAELRPLTMSSRSSCAATRS